jgi:hypothetical protein
MKLRKYNICNLQIKNNNYFILLPLFWLVISVISSFNLLLVFTGIDLFCVEKVVLIIVDNLLGILFIPIFFLSSHYGTKNLQNV